MRTQIIRANIKATSPSHFRLLNLCTIKHSTQKVKQRLGEALQLVIWAAVGLRLQIISPHALPHDLPAGALRSHRVSPELKLFTFSLAALQQGSWYCGFIPLGACSCADKPEVAQPLKYRQKYSWGTTLRPAALAREAHTSSTFIQSNRLKPKCPSGGFPGQCSHRAFGRRCPVSSVHSRSRLFLSVLVGHQFKPLSKSRFSQKSSTQPSIQPYPACPPLRDKAQKPPH